MKLNLQKIVVWLGAVCLLVSTARIHAFALLGPVEPWMQMTNGVYFPGDIGGPMDLTNEYRWNVPVVTYGFDQSFLDYFGSNGVAAVESAIQILNDLPPASSLEPTNYPIAAQSYNSMAQAQSLLDLKSETLALLLEQLGLAPPVRNVFVLKQWTPELGSFSSQWWWHTVGEIDWIIPGLIVRKNFDPQTFEATRYVNDTLYSANVWTHSDQSHHLIPLSVDPYANIYTAVADFHLDWGGFYTGLTYDDVGGLRYLYSTNNVNYETLLTGIQGTGTNENSFVNDAWRPGVDKITFVPQPASLLPGTFLPMTNQFTDTYLTNGNVFQQQLQRVITRPDFLFSAGADVFRTGATNWINNAILNNNPAGAGPGIMQPPVVIAFPKMGDALYTWSGSENLVYHSVNFAGSFDDSTNAPIVYPAPQTGNIPMTVRVHLRHSSYDYYPFQSFEWTPVSQVGTTYALQTSTNLADWVTLFVATNNGTVCNYYNFNAQSSSRYYKLVPQ